MPGSLDSCINSIYEPGNIPGSVGIPPVRVLLRDPFEVEMLEAAAAVDAVGLAETGIDVDLSETAAAADALDSTVDRPWALVNSWTYSSAVPNVNFTGLAGYTEVRVVIRGMTTTGSVTRNLYVSTNNGSSYLTTSGDYVFVASTGVETSRTTIPFASGITFNSPTAGEIVISGWNLTSPKLVQARTTTVERMFVIPTASALNALRVGPASGNITAGSIFVYAR